MTTTARLILASSLLALLYTPLSRADACGQPATPIAEIQGTGDRSPLAGRTVTVEGVLTLDLRHPGGFQGFYLQQADHQVDADPRTSEAVFVYTRRPQGTAGERLRLTGTVKEYHGLTELVGIQALAVCGREALPEPLPITLPWQTPPEALENMRVRAQGPLTVIDNFRLAQYGELTLAGADQITATELHAPGPAALDLARRQREQRLLLDDGRRERDPRPVPWPPAGLTADTSLRAGDRVRDLTGVLDFRFDAWRMQPEASPTFESGNPRPPPPQRPDTPHVRVMAFNLGNYFNGDGRGQGFPTPRGADSLSQFQRQHQRLLAALQAPDPDILSLAEVENDGYGPDSAIAQLARALGPEWRVVATPGQDGDDQIRTAMLYRADRVRAEGPPQRLTTGPFRHRGRPPLSQVFRARSGDAGVRVLSVHLKSKSCRGATGAERAPGNGEGCYANQRRHSAQALVDWLARVPEPANLAGTLVTGDLNAYARETPIELFRAAGYASMTHQFQPCSAHHCPGTTYRYNGATGTLDYALASASLQPRVLAARPWKLNADEPRALGYQGRLAGDAALPWRSSDHDPVITDLRL
ncbi:ExeM/NucH family extracellular endonuclease [Marinobacter qingdaonensis]|uniref:ExeM/NucH family extracellular endonuclease n=1 Tax=Marinobacter qingdaonensis TaxID=3108486 RepID=A0ABU5NWC0_9GAMM|nr:ExeM/NucH family extracellular endonuclease [Marinobacter sp. ASW11-75]MEA1080109.1 ExeM/NucH family extracellular endonuclease [Marinobacter sp. ASW11-75]